MAAATRRGILMLGGAMFGGLTVLGALWALADLAVSARLYGY